MGYTTKNKIGKVISVFSDANGVGATSTTAAMVATALSCKGKKVLLITMDHDTMDAVSYLTDSVVETTLDDLMILANSNGLTKTSDFDTYVYSLSESLDAVRGSSKFDRLSGDPADCMMNIIDLAQYRYHFVVVDIQGRSSQTARTVMNESDLVIYAIGQSVKQLDNLVDDRIFDPEMMNEEAYAMFVATNYTERDFLNVKTMEKRLKQSGFYVISHDEDVMKSSSLKNLYPVVAKATNGGGGGGFLGFGKKKGGDTLSTELGAITDVIMSSLVEPDEEPKYGRRHKRKFNTESED